MQRSRKTDSIERDGPTYGTLARTAIQLLRRKQDNTAMRTSRFEAMVLKEEYRLLVACGLPAGATKPAQIGSSRAGLGAGGSLGIYRPMPEPAAIAMEAGMLQAMVPRAGGGSSYPVEGARGASSLTLVRMLLFSARGRSHMAGIPVGVMRGCIASCLCDPR